MVFFFSEDNLEYAIAQNVGVFVHTLVFGKIFLVNFHGFEHGAGKTVKILFKQHDKVPSFRLFLKLSINQRRFPFDIVLPQEMFSDSTHAAIKENRKNNKNRKAKRFPSAKNLDDCIFMLFYSVLFQ